MARVFDVAKCLLFLEDFHEGDGVTNMKLQKLVYYAQGYYSAIHGEALFPDQIEAWTHGPVIASLYHEYKQYGKGHIGYVQGQFDPDSLSEEELELVKEVYEVFGQFSAWKLRNMTHDEPPWINHEKEAGVIPLTEIKDFFLTRIN